jgi:hypothetical protein
LGKRAGAAIGRQGLESGARVLTSVLDGKDLKQSLSDEGSTGLKNLLDKASQNLSKDQQQLGSGGSNFDFRLYKKQFEDGTSKHSGSLGYANDATGIHGAFTQLTPHSSPINKMSFLKGTNNKKKQLCSIIEPEASKATRKRKSFKKVSTISNNKQLRIDSLGPY